MDYRYCRKRVRILGYYRPVVYDIGVPWATDISGLWVEIVEAPGPAITEAIKRVTDKTRLRETVE